MVEHLGFGIKFGLIEDEDLRSDKPSRETKYQRAERERPWRLVHFHDEKIRASPIAHCYFALAGFFVTSHEVVCNPSFGIKAKQGVSLP